MYMETKANPESLIAKVVAPLKNDARKQAKEIREALKHNCFYVYATDARDGKEYRITAASTSKGVLMGQEIRQGIWFPIRKWEQR